MPQIPFSLQWSILKNDLLSFKDSIDGCLYSTTITKIPGFEYYLKIFPNGNTNEHRGKAWIFLRLDLDDVKKVVADFTITIESANYTKTTHNVYQRSGSWGYIIADFKKLLDPEEKYIADDKLTIKVKGIFKFETDADMHAEQQQKWDGGELGNNLWEKDDDKDFTIIAEGKEIKVHKLILRSRSEVFTAMLNSNMKEANENKVEIIDFSFDVVETALKIIYDCKFATSLSIDELMSLVQFFDRYILTILKEKVEVFLIEQISAKNVCRLTNFSVDSNSSKLKQKCIEFLMDSLASKNPVDDIETLNNDIALKIFHNSFIEILETDD